jgi:hypothetical protein
MHVYDVPPRKDHRGFDLISDVLPFGRLCTTNQIKQLDTRTVTTVHKVR